MKTQLIKTILILFVLSSVPAFADAPPWTGSETYTFDDTDSFFTESSITDTATVNILGGSFGSLRCYEQSKVNMWGGSGSLLWGKEECTINLYGGLISEIAADDNSIMYLWVDSCDIEYNPYIGYDVRLTGTWSENNGNFNIIVRENDFSHINIIPEPTTILLTFMGIALMRNRTRITCK